MGWRYEYWHQARPRPVKGGIRARSRRGSFGDNWWAKRWFEFLDDFDIGQRLARGRSYARGGQVLDIKMRPGRVTARVQGSRRRPYSVRIEFAEFSDPERDALAAALLQRPILAAQLLTGYLPERVELALADAGLGLFPDEDFESDCSCPDWSNPCKHIAAVYLLLGEEFDRDPFLIFGLRGVDRENLFAATGKRGRRAGRRRSKIPAGRARPTAAAAGPEPEPLAADPERFWGHAEIAPGPYSDSPVATDPAALPRQLGGFPFWRGGAGFLPAMEPIYREARRRGLDVCSDGIAEGDDAVRKRSRRKSRR